MTTAPVDPRFAEIQELAAVCKQGDVSRASALLQRHPEVLDSPDRDARFHYPESCIWSPLGIAAGHGHAALVKLLLDLGANPVPYEFAGQYHHHTYSGWLGDLRERGYHAIADTLTIALTKRYGPLFEDPAFRPAVLEGNLDRVRLLLAEKPACLRQVDATGNTALHLAVAANHPALVRLLLEQGAPVDARNGDGRTPAVVALFGLHRWWRNEVKPELLDLLLQHGAQYTLLIAATRGDEPRVRELLRANPALANAPDACFRRPLSGATSQGHTEIVRLLLAHGADPNAREPIAQGGLSLHLAAGKGYTEIARLLLAHGAIPEHWVDSSGDALFAAHHWKHAEILQLLYAHGGTMELCVYAATHRIDVIAEVLKHAPERANEVFPYGWDDNGNEELALNIMRVAIHHGARFENAGGWNLRWTLIKYPRVFRLLQEHGANPDQPLLGLAGDMRRRYKDAAEQLGAIAYLIEHCGANINCHDDEGLTPLALATREGHRDIVEYLLAHGASPNPDGPDWTKPLSLAEHRGFTEIADLLRNHRP